MNILWAGGDDEIKYLYLIQNFCVVLSYIIITMHLSGKKRT